MFGVAQRQVERSSEKGAERMSKIDTEHMRIGTQLESTRWSLSQNSRLPCLAHGRESATCNASRLCHFSANTFINAGPCRASRLGVLTGRLLEILAGILAQIWDATTCCNTAIRKHRLGNPRRIHRFSNPLRLFVEVHEWGCALLDALCRLYGRLFQQRGAEGGGTRRGPWVHRRQGPSFPKPHWSLGPSSPTLGAYLPATM